MKYKYSRKLLSKAYGGYENDKQFIEDLLATSDKPVGKHKHNFINNVCSCGAIIIPKNCIPVLPMCEHKYEYANSFKCSKCGEISDGTTTIKSPPTKDTNKTSLKVPEKIMLNTWKKDKAFLFRVWEKQCELIDYLTLINLDKK